MSEKCFERSIGQNQFEREKEIRKESSGKECPSQKDISLAKKREQDDIKKQLEESLVERLQDLQEQINDLQNKPQAEKQPQPESMEDIAERADQAQSQAQQSMEESQEQLSPEDFQKLQKLMEKLKELEDVAKQASETEIPEEEISEAKSSGEQADDSGFEKNQIEESSSEEDSSEKGGAGNEIEVEGITLKRPSEKLIEESRNSESVIGNKFSQKDEEGNFVEKDLSDKFSQLSQDQLASIESRQKAQIQNLEELKIREITKASDRTLERRKYLEEIFNIRDEEIEEVKENEEDPSDFDEYIYRKKIEGDVYKFIVSFDKDEKDLIYLDFELENNDFNFITNKGLKVFNQIMDVMVVFASKMYEKRHFERLYIGGSKCFFKERDLSKYRDYINSIQNRKDLENLLEGFEFNEDSREMGLHHVEIKISEGKVIATGENEKAIFSIPNFIGILKEHKELYNVGFSIIKYIAKKRDITYKDGQKIFNDKEIKKFDADKKERQRMLAYKRKIKQIIPEASLEKVKSYFNDGDDLIIKLPENFDFKKNIELFKEYKKFCDNSIKDKRKDE